MKNDPANQAAATLLALWNCGNTIADLPDECKPKSEEEGRCAQLAFAEMAGDTIAGWKIAATSAGGQKHIGVNGPLEGPYLSSHLHPPDTIVSMTGNHMAVAEAEFAFRFASSLAGNGTEYSIEEIVEAVGSLHPSLELPDSRLSEFSTAGAATLLADCACGRDWIIGNPTTEDWRRADLSRSPTQLIINDQVVTEGTGADTLGSPITALQWVVNKLSSRGITVEAGQYITTGVCGLPKPISVGDRVTADLGVFGSVSAVLMN